MSTAKKVFDLVVLGGGSGGLACARRAYQHGASVCLIESGRLGGTCVNVGCVPKKIMWSTAEISNALKMAPEFGFTNVPENARELDWKIIKTKRDAFVKRLNGLYGNALNGITVVKGHGSFVEERIIEVDGQQIEGKHVLIATGGKPNFGIFKGNKNLDSSDDFFEWDELPGKVAVVGAGYIAVELAQILKTLGTDVSLFTRHSTPLRGLDEYIKTELATTITKQGIQHIPYSDIKDVTLNTETNKKDMHVGILKPYQDSKEAQELVKPLYSGFDKVLYAVGRVPNSDTIGLDKANVISERGYITVDEYQNTNVPGVYALGDVCGLVTLTPVAVAAGRKLAERLFNNKPDYKLNYENVPSVIFSHPPVATCGLTERAAKAKYGEDNVKVYTSGFRNLFHAPLADRPFTRMKLVCANDNELVVGVHMIGMAVDEVLQGFGVAIAMGATKADLDSCVAIHPTAAEELVTMR